MPNVFQPWFFPCIIAIVRRKLRPVCIELRGGFSEVFSRTSSTEEPSRGTQGSPGEPRGAQGSPRESQIDPPGAPRGSQGSPGEPRRAQGTEIEAEIDKTSMCLPEIKNFTVYIY
jgi:hypothetical protein